MKDFKMKYQVVNLVVAVVCGLLFASFFAWLSASDELKHPCSREVLCFEPYGTIFLYFLKKEIWVGLVGFLLAYVIQLTISLRYLSQRKEVYQ